MLLTPLHSWTLSITATETVGGDFTSAEVRKALATTADSIVFFIFQMLINIMWALRQTSTGSRCMILCFKTGESHRACWDWTKTSFFFANLESLTRCMISTLIKVNFVKMGEKEKCRIRKQIFKAGPDIEIARRSMPLCGRHEPGLVSPQFTPDFPILRTQPTSGDGPWPMQRFSV